MESEQVTLLFQDLNLRDKGPTLRLPCARGADFLREAEQLVRETMPDMAPNMEVAFCFYQEGVVGRTVFKMDSVFWDTKPISCISVFYWCGEKPPSPTKKISDLEEGQKRMEEKQQLAEQRMRFLEINSSSALEREKVWAKRKCWHFEELEKRFPGLVELDVAEVLQWIRTELPENAAKEEQVGLFKLLQILVPRDAFLKDWHSSGPTFAERRHKVDAVTLTQEIQALEYVDTLFEFKKDISTDAEQRDVTLQLVDRMNFVFQAQPMRRHCWGIGLDTRRFVFVSCERSLEVVRVSSPLMLLENPTLSVSLLIRFLSGAPTTRGYIAVVMPKLWGTEAMCLLSGSESKGSAVFEMEGNVAAKVAVSESSITHELEVMRELEECAGLVYPRLVPTSELQTGNQVWPFGFRMARHDVVTVETEENVLSVTGNVLWRLAVLHELGFVHGDVKPSNFLVADTQTMLCDFGNSMRGNGRGLKGGTEAFRVLDGVFREGDFQCDLEGLYWATLTLWRQVKLKKTHWKGLTEDERRRECSVLSMYEANPRECPQNPKLFAYLCKQGKNRRLINPGSILKSVQASTWADWKAGVCEAVDRKELPKCPEEVLEWFAVRLGIR